MAKDTSRKAFDDTQTLSAQVAHSLRQDILDNKLGPGSKLPSEAALEADFSVSRITVRQALATLHADGLIEKIKGKGSFVTRPHEAPDLGPLTGFYEHMRVLGRQAVGRTLSVREVKAPAAAAAALGVARDHPLIALRALRIVDGKPLAVVLSYGRPALMHALIKEDLDTNDLVLILETRLGYRLRSTRIEASAVAAGAQHARQLAVVPGAPLLRINFTPVDVTGQALAYSEMYFRGEAFSYKAVVKR